MEQISNKELCNKLSFTKSEANKLKDARALILDLCKEEYTEWNSLGKAQKQVRMYRKAKELDIDWNCIFIYEYESKGMVK